MAKILLADGFQPVADIERSFLARAGCDLIAAKVGEDLVRLTREDRPDLLVLDMDSPTRDALACCRAVKADPSLRGTRVVLLATALDATRCLEAGGDAVVPRPLTVARLAEITRRYLRIPERSEERVAVALRVDFTRRGADRVGFTRNLGAAGLFLHTSEEFELREAMDLRLHLAARGNVEIRAAGRVARLVPKVAEPAAIGGAGVEFLELGASERIEIGRFVRQHAGGEP